VAKPDGSSVGLVDDGVRSQPNSFDVNTAADDLEETGNGAESSTSVPGASREIEISPKLLASLAPQAIVDSYSEQWRVV